MVDPSLRPRSGSSATSQLLTILGELVLPAGGEVWTRTVIEALGALGIESKNARQALARSADDGVIRSERVGRHARWALTSSGRALLSEGAERIYGFGAALEEWDGRWVVVTCSVPEDQRAKRGRLRTQLGFLGFGFLSAGVAVSPHHDRETAAADVLRELELEPHAVVWRAEVGALVGAHEVLRRGWDLDGLADRYRNFIADIEQERPRSPAESFAALVRLVHEWRRFPFVDPELPASLLPGDWPGRTAKALFDAHHAAWSTPAREWFAALDAVEAA